VVKENTMADVVLQITIPEAYVAKVLAALTALAGKNLSIESANPDWWRGIWQYSFEPKADTETNKDFAVRAVKETVKALVKMVDRAEREQQFKASQAAIVLPPTTVPDDVIK
jgi:hypothetical protein